MRVGDRAKIVKGGFKGAEVIIKEIFVLVRFIGEERTYDCNEDYLELIEPPREELIEGMGTTD